MSAAGWAAALCLPQPCSSSINKQSRDVLGGLVQGQVQRLFGKRVGGREGGPEEEGAWERWLDLGRVGEQMTAFRVWDLQGPGVTEEARGVW